MKHSVLRWITLVMVLAMFLPVGSRAADRTSRPASSGNLETNPGASVFINEVMFAPVAGQYEWVELKNGVSPASIAGYDLTDEDGNWYHIPIERCRLCLPARSSSRSSTDRAAPPMTSTSATM